MKCPKCNKDLNEFGDDISYTNGIVELEYHCRHCDKYFAFHVSFKNTDLKEIKK